MCSSCNEFKTLVTLCPNGVHSKQLVQKHYPDMSGVDLAGIYASGYIKNKDVKVLKSIDFDSFLNKTALPFGLLGCRRGLTNDFRQTDEIFQQSYRSIVTKIQK